MTDDLKDGTAKASARRRLVRGVFSAPAALTLYSGSVAAASVTCIAKQLTNPITVNGDATLVRVPLYMLATGGETAKFVRGADIGSLTPPGGAYLSTNQAQLVSKTGGFNQYAVGGIYATPSGLAPTSPIEYVAVRVSETGRIDGVLSIDVPGQNTALHTSCWTSFGGAVPFNESPNTPTSRYRYN